MSQTLKLAIDGMHCGSCVNRVTNALKKVEGVEVKQVDIGSAEVEFDETKTQPEQIAESVNRIGFNARQN
ncbi:heavy-metal-associated domain-containing protein [Paludibaculum fermentans]|uniref:Heavy-metal-associated domain-containing protein n=1 Tax=Paludibaculum fermentans TaxID=1473598 RepID=A0A7S7NK55_PALFE|nr:heavy metal-associated domain-containing protein [Paludibaculum fermentans]QOY85128.1 heavy-metal-associated domain-containing protein [Paludibaculum fermentans]